MEKVNYVYSSASKEALENLIKEFFGVFNMTLTIEDLFYYGVFCQTHTYAFFSDWEFAPSDLEIPSTLTNEFSYAYERIDCVHQTISQVMRKEIDKPEWMNYVEENYVCATTGDAPSTFLFIEPKSDEYTELAKRLIEFLYSVNNSITMYSYRED